MYLILPPHTQMRASKCYEVDRNQACHLGFLVTLQPRTLLALTLWFSKQDDVFNQIDLRCIQCCNCIPCKEAPEWVGYKWYPCQAWSPMYNLLNLISEAFATKVNASKCLEKGIHRTCIYLKFVAEATLELTFHIRPVTWAAIWYFDRVSNRSAITCFLPRIPCTSTTRWSGSALSCSTLWEWDWRTGTDILLMLALPPFNLFVKPSLLLPWATNSPLRWKWTDEE
jgi:hypothetical protein